MTDSVPNNVATAAAHCLLSDLTEAGLNLAPQSLADPDIGSVGRAETVTIMFLGSENSPEASDLLIAIADKGLNVPKDFIHINLLKEDAQTIESTLGTYAPQIIIVLGIENGIVVDVIGHQVIKSQQALPLLWCELGGLRGGHFVGVFLEQYIIEHEFG